MFDITNVPQSLQATSPQQQKPFFSRSIERKTNNNSHIRFLWQLISTVQLMNYQNVIELSKKKKMFLSIEWFIGIVWNVGDDCTYRSDCFCLVVNRGKWSLQRKPLLNGNQKGMMTNYCFPQKPEIVALNRWLIKVCQMCHRKLPLLMLLLTRILSTRMDASNNYWNTPIVVYKDLRSKGENFHISIENLGVGIERISDFPLFVLGDEWKFLMNYE